MNVCDQCNGTKRVRVHSEDKKVMAEQNGHAPDFVPCPACAPIRRPT